MNPKRLLTTLAVLSLSLTSACVFTPAEPGDVTFAWRFDGYSCDEDQLVDVVRVIIPGEPLANDGFYPCSSNGYDGVTLYDFAPGTYDYQLEAIDYSRRVSFARSGSFYVDGNVLVRVNLLPYY